MDFLLLGIDFFGRSKRIRMRLYNRFYFRGIAPAHTTLYRNLEFMAGFQHKFVPLLAAFNAQAERTQFIGGDNVYATEVKDEIWYFGGY
jgi:hypothetical protein